MRQREAMKMLSLLITALLSGEASVSKAATKEWKAGVTGDWNDPACWVQETIPQDGDDVFITAAGAAASLAAATPQLASVTICRTLLFINWTTQLRAAEVTLKNGALLKLPNSFDEEQMSNRVHIVCSNFIMEQGSTINADFCGYKRNSGAGKGYIASSQYGSGGGHAGVGGASFYAGGTMCGSVTQPELPGSGGGATTAADDAAGGGAVRIEATGNVVLDGIITAKGAAGASFSSTGGGAGGSIWISCNSFVGGASGALLVSGGNAGYASYGGGGSGGRVAIDYTTALFTQGFSFVATPGKGRGNTYEHNGRQYEKPGSGTVFLSDTTLLTETLNHNLFVGVDLHIAGLTSWQVDNLTVQDCSVVLAGDGIELKVAGDMTIAGNGHLGLGHYNGAEVVQLHCGGNLYVTNGGALTIYSGLGDENKAYGALVEVAGDMVVADEGWIYPFCHTASGAAVKFQVSNLWLQSSEAAPTIQGFNANGKGFEGANGAGASELSLEYGAGGGYGGKGGDGVSSGILKQGGTAYGSPYAPVMPGSGDQQPFTRPPNNGNKGGGHGGGLIWIEACGVINCDGALLANGANAGGYSGGGGGGGGIFLQCSKFTGNATANLTVAGGNSTVATLAGGGGGGRIAIWHDSHFPENLAAALLAGAMPGIAFVVTNQLPSFEGTLSAAPGNGYYQSSGTSAKQGTVVFLKYAPIGTVLTIR